MKVTLSDKSEWTVELAIGYVHVRTNVRDCEGTYRTVDFPRLAGGTALGPARYHWTVKQFARKARMAAFKAVQKDAAYRNML